MRNWFPPGRCFNPSKPSTASTLMTSGSAPPSVSGADGRAVRDATDDWLVVDYLMRNTDRHYNNFGLIRDVETLVVRPAPILRYGREPVER